MENEQSKEREHYSPEVTETIEMMLESVDKDSKGRVRHYLNKATIRTHFHAIEWHGSVDMIFCLN
jgi:hypothetical protein